MSASLRPDRSTESDENEESVNDSTLLEILGQPQPSDLPPPGTKSMPPRCFSSKSEEEEAAGVAEAAQHFHHRNLAGTQMLALSVHSSDYEASTGEHDYMGLRRLNFASIGLFGRDLEQQRLQDAYHRISNHDSPGGSAEVCLVHGVSGIGKSALVETLRLVVRRASADGGLNEDGLPVAEGYFVEGKFEQMRQASPYSALNAALTDLCDLVLQSPESGAIRSRIGRNLQQGDIKTLSYLVPNLCQVMGETVTPEDEDDTGAAAAMAGRKEEPVESGRAFTRFRILVRKFLSAVASPTTPLVVFFDDIQWADRASMGIIETLTKDKGLRCVLLVLCCRDNDDLPVIRFIEGLKSSSLIEVTDMHLTELDSDNINDMLSRLLELDPADTRSLAELIIRKTLGNPHHVTQFLKALRSKQLLFYSDEEETWTWDDDNIRVQTNAAMNVVELVKERIGHLPQVTQLVLMFASCLGFNFNVEILWWVVENECLLVHLPDPPAAFVAAIKDGEREGLIEKGLHFRGNEVGWFAGQGIQHQYKFSHDDVQASLYNNFSDENRRDLLHGRIGVILQQLSLNADSQELRDSLQFEATNQYNEAASQRTTYVEKVELARMNAFTASLAVKKYAFDGAANYYRRALEYLDQNRIWQTDYDLIFEILSSLARMEFMLGRFNACQKIVEKVLERVGCLEDQIRVLQIQIESLGVQGDLPNALAMGIEVLERLGEKFPKKPTNVHVMLSFIRLSILLLNKNDDHLLSLREMQKDDNKLLALRILRSVVLYSYFQERVEYICLGAIRMVELTVMHGNSVMAPFAYGMFAMVLSFLQKRDESYRFATLTLCLLRENPIFFREALPGALGAVYCFAAHWRRKLVENRQFLREAHKVGTVVGDFFCGGCATFNAAFFVATSYPALYHEGRAYLSEMKEFGQETLRMLTMPYCQAVDNLVGESEDPVRLTGHIMQEEDFLQEAYSLEHKTTFAGTNFVRLIMTAVFGDWERGLEIIEVLQSHTKTHIGHFNFCFYDFSCGLVWAGAYRREQKRDHWRKFVSIVKKLEMLSKGGVKVCTPLYLFLKAEEYSARNDVEEARRKFDLAIAACSDASYCLYEGLANERCGEMLLSKQHYATEYYLSRAIHIYNEIGAISKREQVKRNQASGHEETRATHYGGDSFNFVNTNEHILAEMRGMVTESSTLGESNENPSGCSTASTESSGTSRVRNAENDPDVPDSLELRLYGRSQESDVLYKSFKGLCLDQTRETARCCLIHGPEGAGKTSLVAGLRQKMALGALVSGKFDQFKQVSRPFGALRQAFSALCLHLSSNNMSGVRDAIAKELRYESPTLTVFIPEMKDVFSKYSHPYDGNSMGIISFRRLVDALRSLMRMVATQSLPLVFFLDDLQWADEESLAIFEALIEDSKTRHVLYVGAYRDKGEDGGVSRLSEQGKLIHKPWVREICLENLSQESVNELVGVVLERKPSEIGDLGKLVYSKSQGNPYHTALFMEHLVAQDLLRLEASSEKRTWCCDEIATETRSCNSATDTMEAKIDRLEGRDVLHLAALLGYEFEIPLLELLLEEKNIDILIGNLRPSSVPSAVNPSRSDAEEPVDLEKMIDEAVSHNLLERVGHHTCRFKGNKLQEVLLRASGSETQRSKIHFRIGKLLLGTDNADKSIVYNACNHLNLGRSHLKTQEDFFELAKVNVEAAKLAIATVGYGWASSRIKLAQLSVDREKKWAKDFGFSLDLCSLTASVGLAHGDHISCRLAADEVSSHTETAKVGQGSSNFFGGNVDGGSLDKSLKGRMSTAVTLLKSFRGNGEFVEAQEYAMGILVELGFPLKNPTPFNVWLDLVLTRWLVNPKTAADVFTTPSTVEAAGKQLAAMEILACMVENSFLMESSEIFALASMQILRLSVRLGRAKYTPWALACYGAILVATLGDVQEGYDCGEKALWLSRQLNEPVYRARTRFVVNLYLKHWREPVVRCSAALRDAHKEAKGSCDLGFSSLSGHASALLLFFSGTDLKQVNANFSRCIQEFCFYDQTVPLLMLRPYLQLTSCLMGEADDPKKLDGYALKKEEFLADCEANMKNIALAGVNAAQLILSCYFGDIAGAKSALAGLDEYDQTPLPHYVHAQLRFFATWTKLQLVKHGGQAKTTLEEARKDLKQLERWSADGAINLKPPTLLLQAEHSVMNRDNEKARTLFDSAIKAAEDMKMVQYEAFSYELAGRHLLDAMNDNARATQYLSKARTLWGVYGSTEKVRQLNETFQSL